MEDVILDINSLQVNYFDINVIRGVSFKVYRNEAYGIIGESGSGKTTIARSILRLMPPGGTILQDSSVIYYGLSNKGIDILKIPFRDFNMLIRWKEISMVPQSALSSLNPVLKVKDHFIETAKSHGIIDKTEALKKAHELLQAVRLDPSRVLEMYSIELSGGMKQRVLIALTLYLNPKIVILDEPTTALDVLTQRVILDLLKRLRREYQLTYILITHDIALVADLVDRLMVIYAGELVEEGNVEDIFYEPLHPYTKLLIESIPKLGDFDRLPKPIPGISIDYKNLPSGCPFHPRCPFAIDICRRVKPSIININKNRRVACHLYIKR